MTDEDPWDAPDMEDTTRRARLTAPGALTAAAHWYAAQGIPVFPLRPGEKTPLPRSNGFKDATTDPTQITAWWTATPQANIGLPTGHLFDVIDIDGPAGYLSLADLRAAGMIPPIIGYALTANHGAHLYIAPTGDGNTAGIEPGVDYRGIGGYVVAPPSRQADGSMWQWSTPLNLGRGPA